ncbi:DUF4142 domain-containing protein [Vitiosangium sp. GDMCC 1.1324]|uniref:DUF4142 domain-containing protein n=1 Tax=Vitiosangium sp. (strain GDMCC 1.1324) TaxID=2138576 RepID=UPI000D371669|nr:DUF4142 domain-containing protein [Vitiosangium sp. GDMCC 1.1324]PTL77719.1 hypothetical protein DAT35_43845 [Vitiosangium sp. GDMCC 1.1324]
MRMRRWLWSAGLLAAMSLGAGCAHNEEQQARAHGENVGKAFAEKVRFADQLSLLNQEQIALGKLALQKSRDPEVRAFANELIQNHKKSEDDLQNLAASKAFTLAEVDLSTEGQGIGGAGAEGAVKGMEKGNEKYDKKYDKQVNEYIERRNKLEGLSGHAFDKAFVEQVKKDQKRGEKLVNEGLKEYRNDTSLALLLSRTAPVINSQQQRVETLKGYLGE